VYKAAFRAMIRRNIRLLNEGHYEPTLKLFATDATLAFPGDNSWSRMFREPQLGSDAFLTHRGRDEIEAFLQRYVGTHIHMEVDDILVNGPPWNARAAARVHHWAKDGHGRIVYSNRAVLFARSRWGKITEQEDYEDTTRVAAFDTYLESIA
jgi:ketosteroid isomerase-like protein